MSECEKCSLKWYCGGKTRYSDKELAERRERCINYLRRININFSFITCDQCPCRCRCPYAYDPYNTDGDCLLAK